MRAEWNNIDLKAIFAALEKSALAPEPDGLLSRIFSCKLSGNRTTWSRGRTGIERGGVDSDAECNTLGSLISKPECLQSRELSRLTVAL
jgi:hypothetical protein